MDEDDDSRGLNSMKKEIKSGKERNEINHMSKRRKEE